MVVSKVVILICTHNPVPEKLYKVLDCIWRNKGDFRVVLIDNASDNSVTRDFQAEFEYTLIYEPRIGNAFARFTALKEVKKNELAIFVDDDNFIDANYVVNALQLFSKHPNWGCFGGRQMIDPVLDVPKSRNIFLPYLGIRDLGSIEKETGATKHWNELEPIGAGMCISPALVDFFIARTNSDQHTFFHLGRKGTGLMSGEDSFIARQAAFLGLDWGYSPELLLIHSIKPTRLKLRYIANLFIGYGRSDVILNKALNVEPPYPYPRSAIMVILQIVYSARKSLLSFITGFRFLGQYFEDSNSK